MLNTVKNAAFALAASGLVLTAAPASALDLRVGGTAAAPVEQTWQQYRDHDRYDRYDRYDRRDDRRGGRYDRRDDRYGGHYEPISRNTSVWRGNDGRTYCRKKDGTTGLLIGGAAGALIGRELDGRGDRAMGTVLGAAAGALLGKRVAQGSTCR